VRKWDRGYDATVEEMTMRAILLLMKLFCYLLIRLFFKEKRPTNCVFHCPQCKETRTAKQHASIEYDKDLRPVSGRSWIVCQTCMRQFNADAFHTDESGVYELESELIRRRDEAKAARS
jgi:hypothetical protein